MKTQNIFKLIPDNLEHEIIESLVQNKKIKIERIISKGHTSPDSGWYNQETDEWVLLLKGAAIIVFETAGELKLAAGDHVTIPAFTKHKVTWTDPDGETIWLAIHY